MNSIDKYLKLECSDDESMDDGVVGARDCPAHRR